MLMSSAAMAAGGRSDGGGDLCENQIKIVRDDLLNWIKQGGPSSLTLPAGISVQHYSDKMVAAIQNAQSTAKRNSPAAKRKSAARWEFEDAERPVCLSRTERSSRLGR